MPSNNRIVGHLQYPTQAEGEAAQAWVANWLANTPNTVRGQATNELTDVIDPPTDEGCLWQLNVFIQMTCPDGDTFDSCLSEFFDAIYSGGVAEAQCSSGLGGLADPV